MNAHHVLEMVTVYRELTVAERRHVQEHVTDCAPCAQALAQAQRVDALLRTLPMLHSTPAQDAALRRRVVASRPAAPRTSAGWYWRPQMAWLVIVIVVAALIGSTGAVAGQSLPDTPLYPLKLAGEQARGWLIWDATGQAEWQLARARTRLDEINRLVAQGRLPSEQTLARLQQQLASALASTSRTPLSDIVRLLQQADALTGDALTQAEVWPLPTADDLAELRASLRQQQRVIAAGLAAPEQFRQTPTPAPANRNEQPPTATSTPLDAPGPTCPPDCTPTPTASPLPTTPSAPTATDAPPSATPTLPAPSTATDTPSAAPTATLTATPPPSATATPTPSATPTRPRILPPRPSGTPRPRPTLPRPPGRTPTATPADTSTVNPAGTPTATPAGTVTPVPTATPTRDHTLPHITRTPRPPPRWTPPRWPPRPTATPVASPVRLATETPTAPPSVTPTPEAAPDDTVTPLPSPTPTAAGGTTGRRRS